MPPTSSTESGAAEFYCPQCRQPVSDPLVCGLWSERAGAALSAIALVALIWLRRAR